MTEYSAIPVQSGVDINSTDNEGKTILLGYSAITV